MAATNQRVILKRGKSSEIPQVKEAGSILIETDTGVAYVDNTSTQRVQLKDPTKLPLEGGTMTGDIDMGDNNITTSHEPEDDNDVVNKKYVDENMKEYTGVDPIIVSNDKISHATVGEQSGGPTSKITLDYGDSFIVPNITTNSFGHTTSIVDRDITLPNKPESVDHADSATNATNADNAKTAESADTAKQSDEASKLSEAQTIDGVSFDGTKAITHYGVCGTQSDDADKTVNCNDFVLDLGSDVEVKFENTNTSISPTLNVNDTGAKPIRYNGSALTSLNADYILSNHIYRFVYDGNYYNIVGDINTDTDTDTVYTATSPILISDDNDISHLVYGEEKIAGPDEDASLRFGEPFFVPFISVDETGHVDALLNRTMTLPVATEGGGGGSGDYTATYPIEISDDNVISHATATSVNLGPTTDQTLEYGKTFTVPFIESDGYGHTTNGANRTLTMPNAPEGVYFGVCDTDSDTSAKEVTCDEFALRNGAIVYVKFNNTNTADYPTLNVSGTGAKSIYFQDEAVATAGLVKDTVYAFVYNDDIYEVISGSFNRIDAVEDDDVTFRNIVIIDENDNPNNIDVPSGSIILQRTSGSYQELDLGPQDSANVNFGESFIVPHFTTDSSGRVVSGENINITMPELENYGESQVGPESGGALNSGSTFVVPYIETNEYGNVVAAVNREFMLINDSSHSDGVCYGTCDTDAEETTKIVDIDDDFSYKNGALICVTFSITNTASDISLSINDTEPYPVYYQGKTIGTFSFLKDTTYIFLYRDDMFELIGGDDFSDAINDIYNKLSLTLSMDSTYYDTGGVDIEDLQTQMTKVVETVDTLQNHLDEVVNLMYPVGSIYISVNSTSPATLFGGTWEQIEDTFLLASGSTYGLNTTGGASAVTLSSSEIPSHTHSITSHTHSLPSHTHSLPSHTHSTPSHTHSIPALSGTAASAGSHTHTISAIPNKGASGSDLYIVDDGSTATATSSPINSAGAHTHTVTTTSSTTGSSSGTSGSTSGTSGETSGTSGSYSGTSGSTGSGNAHENMPPYLAVNVWKRTA